MLRTSGFGLASLLVTLVVALGLPSYAAAQNRPGTLFSGDGTGLFGALQSAISPASLAAPLVVLPAPSPARPTASTVSRTEFASFAQTESSAGSTTVRLVESIPVTSLASTPRVISYQGILKNATGSLAQDGDYTVTMRLYGDSIGIKELWRDTYRVQVTGGVFDILLGSGQQPLPESAVLDQPMWISMQMGALDEMRPFAPIASVPYALNVADKSITAGKISADYVRSLTINGQTVVGNGADISIQTGDGIAATVDSATGTILLKGGQAQGNTTISGSLTVTGTTYLGSGDSMPVVVYSLSANQPVKTNGNKGLVSGAIDLSNGSETDVSGTLGAANGGTGQNGYTAGDMLYASSSSALSKLGVGSANQVLGVSGGAPAYVQNGATITNTVNSPANLTSGPVNNYSVDGSSTYIRLNNTSGASIDLTGINNTSVANGRSITLVNTSAASADLIVIRHHNGSSTSGNQFDLPGGGDIILAQRGTATFTYDATTGYWALTSTN